MLYFEPLKAELNDCFGALKDVTPDFVYSNIEGASTHVSGGSGDASSNPNETEVDQAEPSTSAQKKKPKSNCIKYLLNIYLIKFCASSTNVHNLKFFNNKYFIKFYVISTKVHNVKF